METADSKHESINSEPQIEIRTIPSFNENIVLCDHCKRTASNGVRCLGMCVADNDY
mgnify:CR=1 FL=1|tara:strand:+ start:543 stop:710 length:168 start_codon:yes stop_codon:yes gene_type:complete